MSADVHSRVEASRPRALFDDAPSDPLWEPPPHRLTPLPEDHPREPVWLVVALVAVWFSVIGVIVAGMPW